MRMKREENIFMEKEFLIMPGIKDMHHMDVNFLNTDGEWSEYSLI